MAARLVAIAGPVKGRTWTLSEGLSIGRSSLNQVQVEDLSLSRQQCVIREESGRFHIEDKSSSNGTFVNGLPITCHVLEHRDEIRAGHCLFVFLQEDPSREEEDAAPPRHGVELDQDRIESGSTLVLRSEDAL
jgi:pSer/pThr/pTyr-binding forkhead associated (FHA) protein